MGHGRRRALLTRAKLEDNQGLVGGIGDLRGFNEAHRVRHAFKNASNRAARRIIRQEGNAIRNINIRRIAGGEKVADGHTTHHRLRQRKAKRPRLADQPHRMRQGCFHGRWDHESHAGLAAEIQHANTIRPDNPHPRIAPNLG